MPSVVEGDFLAGGLRPAIVASRFKTDVRGGANDPKTSRNRVCLSDSV